MSGSWIGGRLVIAVRSASCVELWHVVYNTEGVDRQVRNNVHRTGSTLARPRNPAALAMAAGAVVSFLLAGCSSSSGSKTGALNSSGAGIKTGQGVSGSTIKVGVVLDQSGPLASISGAIKATIDARMGALDAAGGVAGRKISLTYLDDKGDPALQLTNYQRLWQMDKVAAIIGADAFALPYQYIQKNKIPVVTEGADPGEFSSKYPTIMTLGGQIPGSSAEMAYSVVNYLHRQPKVVAVTYQPSIEPVLGFIKEYWTKLGATKIITDPDPGPTGDCTSLVLKYKDAGVDFWDEQGIGWLSCIPAELKLGWSPSMGQGSPLTSAGSLVSAIGKPIGSLPGGLMAGSHTIAVTGPSAGTLTPLAQEYIDNMKKYSPKYGDETNLGDSAQMADYQTAALLADVLTGAAQQLKSLTPASIVQYGNSLKNWNAAGLSDPVVSFAPNCKTGTDSTSWGTWKWNESTKKLTVANFAPPTGSTHLVNNKWLSLGECYLTQIADKYYTN